MQCFHTETYSYMQVTKVSYKLEKTTMYQDPSRKPALEPLRVTQTRVMKYPYSENQFRSTIGQTKSSYAIELLLRYYLL